MVPCGWHLFSEMRVSQRVQYACPTVVLQKAVKVARNGASCAVTACSRLKGCTMRYTACHGG